MPIYMRFMQNGISGAVGSRASGWEKSQEFRSGQSRWVQVDYMSWSTPSDTVVSIAISKEFDSVPPKLAPYKNDPDHPVLIAQIAFTRAGHGGGEIADLRVQLHGVRIVRSERAVLAGRAAPFERIVIRYSRMTQAGAPETAPDISHQARARVAHGSPT